MPRQSTPPLSKAAAPPAGAVAPRGARAYSRDVDKSRLISIGRFARLTDLSPKLLRKLDERGVLRPACVDPDTGYRYYEAGQTRVAGLVHLGRQLELTLGEIARLVATEDDAELRRQLAEHRRRLAARLDDQARVLHLLDQELARDGRLMEYDIAVRRAPATLVMSARGSFRRTHPHDPWALEAALREAGERAARHLTSLGEEPDRHPIIVYFSDFAADDHIEFDVCFPVSHPLPGAPGVSCLELPATRLASTTYRGAYDTIWSAYLSLRAWVADNGLVAAGEVRERGVVDDMDTADATRWITELSLTLAG